MNALDAMDDCSVGQKRLSVSVRADAPGQVCVAVRDSGTGLPPDAPERIFESFVSTKTRVLRRLQLLREWSHERVEEVFT
jgi:C4-dicarboxylate-specific signal transduction histidine kinase